MLPLYGFPCGYATQCGKQDLSLHDLSITRPSIDPRKWYALQKT